MTAMPVAIARLLDTNDATERATLLLACPRHAVPLAHGAQAAPVDLWALARTPITNNIVKGLILAQNERWRRGLGMQVERIPAL